MQKAASPSRAATVIVITALALIWPQAPVRAADPPVPLNSCADDDNGDPVVTDVAASPTSVTLAARPVRIALSVAAEDRGGPGPAGAVESVDLYLRLLRTGRLLDPVPLKRDGGRWTGYVVLAPGQGLAGRLAAEFLVRDRSGNVAFRRSTEWPTISVIDGTRTDRRDPQLLQLSLSKRAVQTRSRTKTIAVRAHVADTSSGVREVLVRLARPASGEETIGTSSFAAAFLARVSGTARDGIWTGRVRIPRWAGDEPWAVSARVRDHNGNGRGYGRASLRRLGMTSSLVVRSRTDHLPPGVAITSAVPTTMDVRGGDQELTVSVHAADGKAGIAYGRVELRSPDDLVAGTADLRLVAGTRGNGVWRAEVDVARCGTTPGNYSLEVTMFDRAGNLRAVSRAGAVTVQAADTTSPDAGVGSGSPSVGVRILFNEEVLGVSRDSTQLLTDDGQAVSGDWRCLDRSGAVVDCWLGPLTVAELVTPTPLPHGSYVPTVNPEFNLDVRDLAGNPMRSPLPGFGN